MRRGHGRWLALLAAVLLACGVAPAGAQTPAFKVQADAVYFDLDGTALASGGKIPEVTIAAVRHFRECGGKVGIATGRALDQTREAMAALECELPIVLYNGGAAMDPKTGDYLFMERLPLAVVTRTLATIRPRADVLGANVHGRDAAWEAFGGDSTARFTARTGLTLAGRWPEKPSSTHPIVKVILYARPASAAEVRDALQKRLGKTARVIRSGPSSIEVVPPGVNKASAIRRALAMRGEQLPRIVTFGDSGNDVEMLREFSLGIAMGNCLEEACRAAMVRIGDHNSGDLARAVQDVLVGPKCWETNAAKK